MRKFRRKSRGGAAADNECFSRERGPEAIAGSQSRLCAEPQLLGMWIHGRFCVGSSRESGSTEPQVTCRVLELQLTGFLCSFGTSLVVHMQLQPIDIPPSIVPL